MFESSSLHSGFKLFFKSSNLILTGSYPGEVWRPSRPEYCRRQRPCQPPFWYQWTWGVHLKGITVKQVYSYTFICWICCMTPWLHLISSGDSSWVGKSMWAPCWRPDIRGEQHWPATCHTPGSCAGLAGQQAGDPYVGTAGPFTAGNAGNHDPEAAWRETWYQHSRRGQGSCWKSFRPHRWGHLHLKGSLAIQSNTSWHDSALIEVIINMRNVNMLTFLTVFCRWVRPAQRQGTGDCRLACEFSRWTTTACWGWRTRRRCECSVLSGTLWSCWFVMALTLAKWLQWRWDDMNSQIWICTVYYVQQELTKPLIVLSLYQLMYIPFLSCTWLECLSRTIAFS